MPILYENQKKKGELKIIKSGNQTNTIYSVVLIDFKLFRWLDDIFLCGDIIKINVFIRRSDSFSFDILIIMNN